MQYQLEDWKILHKTKYAVPPRDLLNRFKPTIDTVGLQYLSQKRPVDVYQDLYKTLNGSGPSTYDVNLFASFRGVIQGFIFEKEKPLANCWVTLYQASTGLFVTRAFSNSEGFFKLSSVAKDTSYYIVASDPRGVFNSVTIDGIRIDSRKEYNNNVG